MAKKSKTVGGTPATVALSAAGIAFEVRAYEHDPHAESYGLEAAEALDADPATVFKTLLASLDPSTGSGRRDTLVVGIVPVTGQLDLKALARALGGSKAVMAEVAAAERATGYVAGGISPIGQKRAHPTVLDASALDHDTILVSGGRRGFDIALAPRDLVAITGAVTATIGR
ncbi:Cys-tRNA(Pro)/Cys-tRNA(Cys) deacylase [Nocardioides exalbidus]|uniref:Cys-tRNA(Pro)/Cys-tRNA(Cys) deacylase n=1 Tax=Nocardioides exalbidus TaxID=402596 RepID=A0A1H4ZKQ9_9ACTN|nr:Cys-tRNA(Pro) deacylase [Nocardioides exalbidus]SED30699.1 Cys-tRNA(Pro)/Cys-tRNA(Cys) deacylase [Nocardioides exalbidus]